MQSMELAEIEEEKDEKHLGKLSSKNLKIGVY